MAQSRLYTRLQRLEQSRHAQQVGMLYVWRLPDESAAEAFVRCQINQDDYPQQVRLCVWRGGELSARLACPPRPVWISAMPGPASPLDVTRIESLTRQANERLARIRRPSPCPHTRS